MPLVLIFFLTPIVEMYLLIEVAGYIKTLPTIGLVMLTAVIGVALLKRQGVQTLTRGVGRLNRGEVPATEIAEGILLGIAGALLITPGFVTDAVGFLLLFPPTRQMIAATLIKRVEVSATNNIHMHVDPQQHSAPNESVTIEGEYEKRP